MKYNKENRTQKGALVSFIGIFCNLALAAGKIAAGFFFGLVSVLADGFNNLSDCGSGIVSLVSFRIADKPADREHPYGHRRAEYIAAMITGFFVLFLAAELLRESSERIMNGESAQFPPLLFLLLGISVAVKAGLYLFYRYWAGRIQSEALKAAATDSLCDCIATGAVILGAVLSRFEFSADGWTGILISLFIFCQGLKILAEASSALLGQAPDPKLLGSLKTLLLAPEEVLGIHDLRIYSYGKDTFFATVHIEMDAKLSSSEAHTIIDELERMALSTENVALTAHLDPVDLDDEEAKRLREEIFCSVRGLADGLELHDFRLIRGAKKKVLFDAGIPYACKLTDKELLSELESAVHRLGDYEPVVTVERE